MSNVVSISTKAQRSEIDRLREQLPTILAGQSLLAEVTKAKYDALIAQGFSEAQALELCK